jgi:hypothetical protein
MQYAGFGLLALALGGLAWWVARLMTSSNRNNGATHGGGLDDMNRDAWAGHDSTDATGGV